MVRVLCVCLVVWCVSGGVVCGVCLVLCRFFRHFQEKIKTLTRNSRLGVRESFESFRSLKSFDPGDPLQLHLKLYL